MLSLSLHRTHAARLALIALAALMVLTFSISQPAQAETAGQRSTRNIILAGVALATAIILYDNYHHKQVAHDTIVGRTADGGIVYADGRIVYPNGTVVYTSNDGRSPCSYDGYGVPCGRTVRAYRVARVYDYDEYTRDSDNDHPRYVDYDDRRANRDRDDRVYQGRGNHYGWQGHDGGNQGNHR
jgi:hypothetical protein